MAHERKLAAIWAEQSRINREIATTAVQGSRWPVENTNYLPVREVTAIPRKARCGNCRAEGDLTHFVTLNWMLCGECRKLYVQALKELSPSGQIARRYQPIGAYAPVEYEHE